MSRLDALKPDLFLDGPTEFLIKSIAQELLKVPQFAEIFGESVDGYKRMDYSMRELPGLRIYNENMEKEFESWFINGDVIADVILPPEIRRNETQQFQDTLSSALLQQFRRPTFFNTLLNLVPGLNELGKRYSVNKSLGFMYGDEDMAPLTQISLNFRLDLREWDRYLEERGSTKDDPFEITLGKLTQINKTIRGLRDDLSTKEVEIKDDQRIGG